MSVHKHSKETYLARIEEGIDKTVKERVIHFMSYHNEPFARFHLVDLLGIKESTLCGALNQLEKKEILYEAGSIRSEYNRPNKLYQINSINKKEPPQGKLF